MGNRGGGGGGGGFFIQGGGTASSLRRFNVPPTGRRPYAAKGTTNLLMDPEIRQQLQDPSCKSDDRTTQRNAMQPRLNNKGSGGPNKLNSTV